MSDDHATGDPWDRLTRWLKSQQAGSVQAIISGALSPTEYAGFCREQMTYAAVLEHMEEIRLGRDTPRRGAPRARSIEE
jgi:hypothetical protein